ncbi:hypothetical protein COO60DRAFT_275982 [Scenedesmus sp. NREL 46B-D3]|nr:hypothetical protein COO60DRAFT_275982 [Scenedesmus sp. NREL 46B-D3]
MPGAGLTLGLGACRLLPLCIAALREVWRACTQLLLYDLHTALLSCTLAQLPHVFVHCVFSCPFGTQQHHSQRMQPQHNPCVWCRPASAAKAGLCSSPASASHAAWCCCMPADVDALPETDSAVYLAVACLI